MVDIRAAVASAKVFAEQALGPERTTNVRLEEVESSKTDSEPVWLITLSMSSPPRGDGPISAIRAMASVLGADIERDYRVFTVSKNTGETLSMKIRVFAVPSK